MTLKPKKDTDLLTKLSSLPLEVFDGTQAVDPFLTLLEAKCKVIGVDPADAFLVSMTSKVHADLLKHHALKNWQGTKTTLRTLYGPTAGGRRSLIFWLVVVMLALVAVGAALFLGRDISLPLSSFLPNLSGQSKRAGHDNRPSRPSSSSSSPSRLIEWDALDGHFNHQPTGNDFADWKARLKEIRDGKPPVYPTGRFSGRGIVLATTMNLIYFTQLYVSLRVLVHHCKTKLPIEVLYFVDEEPPASLLKHIATEFPTVRMINLFSIPDFALYFNAKSIKNFEIKSVSVMFCSFEEVLYLDSDNLPLADPAFVFDLPAYRATGALFWPDYCSMVSARPETFDLFGFPPPITYPSFDDNATIASTKDCKTAALLGPEAQCGELLFNKRVAWRALMLAILISQNSKFFYKYFWGDKPTWAYAFNATNSPYTMSPYPPFGLAVGGKQNLCVHTIGQRHPETGELIWLHRYGAKFAWTAVYLQTPEPRAWTHIVQQGSLDAWGFSGWPEELVPIMKQINMGDCSQPTSPTARRIMIDSSHPVWKLENACLQYLRELAVLPFYRAVSSDCAGDKAYFCRHV